MKEKDLYMKQVDLIFSILDKIEASWKNNDNLNYIEELRKYKNVLINATPKSSNSDLEILDSKKVSWWLVIYHIMIC